MTTADGLFSYLRVVNGNTLFGHAVCLNAYLARRNGWSLKTRLAPGQWGTDINVSRIASALPIDKTEDVETVAERIHEGWARCFRFWLARKPWLWKGYGYKRPRKSLSSKHKIARAHCAYSKLNSYQKSLYRQMAEYVFEFC